MLSLAAGAMQITGGRAPDRCPHAALVACRSNIHTNAPSSEAGASPHFISPPLKGCAPVSAHQPCGHPPDGMGIKTPRVFHVSHQRSSLNPPGALTATAPTQEAERTERERRDGGAVER